ncbi:MAG: HEAT repeat domain-containing protein [Candidatus Heimdallarchaeota archaeon]|nr:HEAT repeat domain-containing protein [Candidatus Heimdallarchaeota archaeon]
MNQKNLEDLTKDLLESDEKITRMRAAITLSSMGEKAKEAIPALIEAIEKDESSKIREEAAKALGKIGKGIPSVATALVNAMMDDKSENVRIYAAESMADIGEVAVPALLDVLRKESNIEVKEKTIDALGSIGAWAQKEAPGLVNSLVAEIIKVISKEPNELIHRVSSEAFLKMGEAAIKPLIKAYRDYSDASVLREIEITLEKLAGKLGYRNRQALIRVFDSD